jgi:hypothetical protein
LTEDSAACEVSRSSSTPEKNTTGDANPVDIRERQTGLAGTQGTGRPMDCPNRHRGKRIGQPALAPPPTSNRRLPPINQHMDLVFCPTNVRDPLRSSGWHAPQFVGRLAEMRVAIDEQVAFSSRHSLFNPTSHVGRPRAGRETAGQVRMPLAPARRFPIRSGLPKHLGLGDIHPRPALVPHAGVFSINRIECTRGTGDKGTLLL